MQKDNNKWKSAVAVLACTTVAFAALFSWQLNKGENAPTSGGNFTDEMKLPYAVNLNDYGINSFERQGIGRGNTGRLP